MSETKTWSDEDVLRHFRIAKPPPEGFQPLAAADRELKLYGFPSRPDPRTHPKLAALWQRSLARPLHFITSNPRVDRRMVHRPRRNLSSSAGSSTSTNWSGAFVNQPQSQSLNSVSGAWIVPDVAPPPSAWNGSGWNPGTYSCLVWVGIDGWNGTSDVLQAGTLSQVTVGSNGQVSGTSFTPIIEWYGNAWITESNLTVNAGDLVLCTVCAPIDTQGAAFFLNQTTGQTVSYPITPPSGVTLSGNVAEWIVEDPGTIGSTVLDPFPNYGATLFRDVVAGTQEQELDLGSATSLTLVDSSGNTLSVGVIETNDLLVCYCGPNGA
jgi:hypothetical protein